MLVRLKKIEGGVILSCIRAPQDSAVQRTGHGGFFALHDLMHYAIETTFGLDQAFYGLMASGWSFENFTRKDDPSYRPLPEQAVLVEHLVATMTRHHRDQTTDPDLLPLLTDDINQDLAASCTATNSTPITLTPADITAIYHRFDTHARQWQALPIGGHLELPFPG